MTPHEWALLVVELIKAVAWPVAAGLIAWRAGPALLALFSGRSVDLQGFGIRATIRAIEQQQITSEDTPVAQRPALEPAPAATQGLERPALQLIEGAIRTELPRYPNREAALITALATARLRGQHEYTYNRIFGSQIAALKSLDEIGGATVDQARQFYEPYAREFPNIYQNYGFDGWLAFLIGAGLVARDGDRLTATTFGHDFLVYLREVRLTETKPG